MRRTRQDAPVLPHARPAEPGHPPAGPAPGARAADHGDLGEAALPGGAGEVGLGDGLEREAGLARLFDLHYTSMLRLASLLGADDPEDIVAEAYYQIYRKWKDVRKTESTEAYLRSVVCNLSRMRIRHLQVVRKHTDAPPMDWAASAESSALLRDDQRVLVSALQLLPARQREALVLRYWLGLKEGEIAAAMGISTGSVKTHTARGVAALTMAMESRR